MVFRPPILIPPLFFFKINTLRPLAGRPIPRTRKSVDQIQESIAKHSADGDFVALEAAQIEEMMVMGHLRCPEEKTLRQRAKYFGEVNFLDLKQLLELAENVDFV